MSMSMSVSVDIYNIIVSRSIYLAVSNIEFVPVLSVHIPVLCLHVVLDAHACISGRVLAVMIVVVCLYVKYVYGVLQVDSLLNTI